jgi:hypothetical protein
LFVFDTRSCFRLRFRPLRLRLGVLLRVCLVLVSVSSASVFASVFVQFLQFCLVSSPSLSSSSSSRLRIRLRLAFFVQYPSPSLHSFPSPSSSLFPFKSPSLFPSKFPSPSLFPSLSPSSLSPYPSPFSSQSGLRRSKATNLQRRFLNFKSKILNLGNKNCFISVRCCQ